MNYYKLIDGRTIVGIGTSHNLRKYQQKHRILIVCDENAAQYIQCNDVLYHADWMLEGEESINAGQIDVVQISKEEYDIIENAFKTNEVVEEPQEEEPTPEPVQEDTPTVEFVKNAKLKEIRDACNAAIVAGFDVVLTDGESHHFSLTVQDQLNLITLTTFVANGETKIPYHADGELCRYYTAEEVLTITNAATAFKTYHVTYHNSLKAYVESLDAIEDIAAVYYGVHVDEEYQSEILRDLEDGEL